MGKRRKGKRWRRKIQETKSRPASYWQDWDSEDWDNYQREGSILMADKPAGGGLPTTTTKPTTVWTARNCKHVGQPIPLLDNLFVQASSWTDAPWSYETDADIGFYLDNGWVRDELMASVGFHVPTVGGEGKGKVFFPWKDYGLPVLRNSALLRMVRWLLWELGQGKTVEVGCTGGHGRTGTMVACLLIAQGMPAFEAKAYIWENYCQLAIETKNQEEFLEEFEKAWAADNRRRHGRVTQNTDMRDVRAVPEASNVSAPTHTQPSHKGSRTPELCLPANAEAVPAQESPVKSPLRQRLGEDVLDAIDEAMDELKDAYSPDLGLALLVSS